MTPDHKLTLVRGYLDTGLPLDVAARLAGVPVAVVPLEWHPRPVELRDYLFSQLPTTINLDRMSAPT